MSRGCEFYADALVELARGELDAERVARVEDHLSECAECRDALETIRAVRAAPTPIPVGLEARIQTAVRTGAVRQEHEAPVIRLEPRPTRSRVWALPVAAAAALVLWLGADALLDLGTAPPDEVTVAEYDPYGAWPAADGVVAGELVLSELSVEELEALLEEMER